MSIIEGASIKTEMYRDRKHYVIRANGEKIWVDKETFFITRNDYEGQVTEYFVETNCVTDEDILKPDFTGYEMLVNE